MTQNQGTMCNPRFTLCLFGGWEGREKCLVQNSELRLREIMYGDRQIILSFRVITWSFGFLWLMVFLTSRFCIYLASCCNP